MFISCCQVTVSLGDSTYNTHNCCYPLTIDEYYTLLYYEKKKQLNFKYIKAQQYYLDQNGLNPMIGIVNLIPKNLF